MDNYQEDSEFLVFREEKDKRARKRSLGKHRRNKYAAWLKRTRSEEGKDLRPDGRIPPFEVISAIAPWYRNGTPQDRRRRWAGTVSRSAHLDKHQRLGNEDYRNYNIWWRNHDSEDQIQEWEKEYGIRIRHRTFWQRNRSW